MNGHVRLRVGSIDAIFLLIKIWQDRLREFNQETGRVKYSSILVLSQPPVFYRDNLFRSQIVRLASSGGRIIALSGRGNTRRTGCKEATIGHRNEQGFVKAVLAEPQISPPR